jgi:DNA-binding transcriptional LysR family regulator
MAEWREPAPRGPVAIAGDSLWHHYLLPPLLTELVGRWPALRPCLHEMLPDDVERWVAAGEIDIGLLLRPPVRTDLAWTEGLASPYVIAGRPQPKGHWQDFGYIVPRFFRRELPESLDGWPEARFPRRIAAEVELLETALHLAEAGLGAAFLPELALRERLERGTLAIVAEAPVAFQDQLFVVWRQGVRPTPATRALLEALGALPQAAQSATRKA